jgi:hypothetical protein
VNGNPAAFTITGGGISFCPGTPVTLAGPINPNYTYSWGRSLSGLPNSFGAYGGTASTQNVDVSGNYQLTVH